MLFRRLGALILFQRPFLFRGLTQEANERRFTKRGPAEPQGCPDLKSDIPDQ